GFTGNPTPITYTVNDRTGLQSNVATITITYRAPAADLALSKVVDDPRPNVGDTITFRITLTNNGPDTATNVDVTDVLPDGLTLDSATPSQGIYNAGTGLWIVGNLVNGAQATLVFHATVISPDAQTNTATITAADQPDPNDTNNTASATATPQ